MDMGNQKFNPYDSIEISSLEKSAEVLENVLSSKERLFPRKADKPVVIYGAGSLGKMAKDFFDYLKVPYLYAVDRNAGRCETDAFWKGIKIIHPDDVEKADKENCLLVVCIVTTKLMPLRKQLLDCGWKDVVFFYDICEFYKKKYPINNGWFLSEINDRNKTIIKRIYLSLDDDVSRAFYLQFLAWRRLRIELTFKGIEVETDNRFFIPQVVNVLKDKEVFVDCGAHRGGVIKRYLEISKGKYSAIYAFEPDSENFEILKKEFGSVAGISLIKKALGSKSGREKFYDGFDFASKISKNGNAAVDVVALDGMNIKASFIKMHLEGGELEALKGGLKMIKESRPILAVTFYHNEDGAWRIPLLFINNLENYSFYIRLHSWGGTGAVFYAIPRERH